ncbi:arpA protein [Frankia sp. CcI49]|uniref:HalD/BesD family halogenase n=1 Tax=unclassified Frankia TaxID=2632575 RepID=UPI0006CA3A79|nr:MULTISPECIES: ArpA protein [unclassified Frankia]KPM55510.1 arpA protein [Frankia sp. R43]ONH62187.1 arpA protein [Frankia sp. CcI49]
MGGTAAVNVKATSPSAIEDVIDTDRYPLCSWPDGAAGELVGDVRRQLADTGCCVLPDFVRPSLHARLRDECTTLAPSAHYDAETVNVYNIDADAELPPGHPGRVGMLRGNAFVARDRIPADHVIHRLYVSTAFRSFVAACFGLPAVHELADPLSGLCLNVVVPGQEHPWHFDTNEFTVSLLTQGADAGGVFEYCPGIRSAEAENFDDVSAVLAGGTEGERFVHRLDLRPGDLQLFLGRYSLHRVSRVAGATQRHSAIFAYSERPGVVGSVSRTRQLFGRVLPEHLAAARRAVRVDGLLD